MSVEFSAIINFINYFVFIFRNKPSDLLIRKPAALLCVSESEFETIVTIGDVLELAEKAKQS